MLLVVLILLLALVTGVLGVAVKGLLWLLVVAGLLMVTAVAVGRIRGDR